MTSGPAQRAARRAARGSRDARAAAARAPARHRVSDFLVEQLERCPAVKAAVVQMLRAIEQRGAAACAVGPTARSSVHPGSGGDRKCWPNIDFVELIERLRRRGRRASLSSSVTSRRKSGRRPRSHRSSGAGGGGSRRRLTDLLHLIVAPPRSGRETTGGRRRSGGHRACQP